MRGRACLIGQLRGIGGQLDGWDAWAIGTVAIPKHHTFVPASSCWIKDPSMTNRTDMYPSEETPDSPVEQRPWQEVAEAKRRWRDETISRHEEANETALVITSITEVSDIDSLVRLLGSGEVSAQDVVRAYIHKYAFASDQDPRANRCIVSRACIAQQKVSYSPLALIKMIPLIHSSDELFDRDSVRRCSARSPSTGRVFAG